MQITFVPVHSAPSEWMQIYSYMTDAKPKKWVPSKTFVTTQNWMQKKQQLSGNKNSLYLMIAIFDETLSCNK